ncbi:MAG: methyltransferase family protein [Oceanococcus sp.]
MNDHFLNTRIPPLLLVAITALSMWLLQAGLPPLWLPESFNAAMRGLKFTLAFSGALVALLGVIEFRRAQTTVDPRQPDMSNALVSSGVYQFSRNPMYVGFAMWLIAWGCQLAQLWSLLLVPVFIVYMNRFQIEPEERILKGLFGESYAAYLKSTPRWLALPFVR